MRPGTEHDLGQVVAHHRAAPGRRGRLAVEQRPFGRLHRHRPEAAFVVRHRRVQRQLDRVHAVGARHVERGVHRRRHLSRRARVVDHDRVALHYHRHLDADAGHVADGRQRHVVLVGAVGHLGDLRAQALLGAGADLLGERQQRLRVELVVLQHADEAATADVVGDDLRAQVAEHLVRRAHVGADDLADRLVELARPVELHHRQAQAFLEHVLGLGGGHAAADVEVVDDADRERHELLLVEDRGGHAQVVGMPGALPGVVGEQRVAVPEVLQREVLEEVAHHIRHHADEGRGGLGRVREEVALDVKEAAGEVVEVAHHRRVRSADEACGGFVRDRQHAVPEDLGEDRIELLHLRASCEARVTTRQPNLSTVSLSPRSITVVDSRSSMMAGPRTLLPGPRALRS